MRKYEETYIRNDNKLYQEAYEVFEEKDILLQKAHNLFAIIQNPDYVYNEDLKFYQNTKEDFINYTHTICNDIETIAKRLAKVNE